jgi:hypothetical protein
LYEIQGGLERSSSGFEESEPMILYTSSTNPADQGSSTKATSALRKIDEVLSKDGQVEPTQPSSESNNNWSPRETMTMSGAALAYSLVVLLVAAVIAKGLKSPEQAIRLFTVVLIINSAVFFIVAGYSSQQIAPAVGLLGTMAGYVLGKSQDNNKDQGSSKE